MKQSKVVGIYLALSVVAAALLLLILQLGARGDADTLDRQIITGMFAASCVFGISLAFKPNWRRSLVKATSHRMKGGDHLHPRKRGHHPACSKFKKHVIILNNKYYCAGCHGLAAGSAVALGLVFGYYILSEVALSDWLVRTMGNWPVPLSGLLLVALNLSLTSMRIGSVARVVLNTALAPAFFLVIIGTFEMTGELVHAFLALVFCFLWLDTRIQLSRWAHLKTCRRCPKPCKSY